MRRLKAGCKQEKTAAPVLTSRRKSNIFTAHDSNYICTRKGVFAVKKLIAVILALALLGACCTALAEGETEIKQIQFFLPATVDGLQLDPLPVYDFPTMKTKRVSQITTVTVNGDLDRLTANWMGYGESPEEITMTDGVGQFSSEGHKYSVGTHWIKGASYEWLDWYDYYGNDETFADAEAALKAEHQAEFKTGAGAVVEDTPWTGFAVFHYRWSSYYDEAAKDYVELENVYEQIGGMYDTYEAAKAAADALGESTSSSEYSDVYGAIVYTYEGYYVERFGGYADLYKRHYSNGWPNRAYTLYTGEYAVDYTRAGVINYAQRTMENTDVFHTGIEGAKTIINWEVPVRKGVYVPRVTGVSVIYPEGSQISSITVSYRSNGKVYRYTIKYNAGGDKSYTTSFTAKDKLAGATYLIGDSIIAKHSMKDTWVNIKTGMYEHFLESAYGELLTSAVRVQ